MENEFLENVPMESDDKKKQNKDTKKLFSKIGLTLFTMVFMVQVIQIIFYQIVNVAAPELLHKAWMPWAYVVIGFYITAFPVYCILMKRIPSTQKGETKHMKVGKVVAMFFICMAAVYLFNYLTLAINYFIGLLKGGTVVNPIGEVLASSNLLYNFIFAGVVAPIIEEIVFRGILLDKIRCYGDKTAIWVTALAFGLFHLNLSQFFYATALGILFAYVAVRTNRIKYSIILHMCVNIMGSVLTPVMAATKNPILINITALMVISILTVGITLFVKKKKYVILEEGSQPIDSTVRKKTIYGNFGMMCYLILCFILIVITTMQ